MNKQSTKWLEAIDVFGEEESDSKSNSRNTSLEKLDEKENLLECNFISRSVIILVPSKIRSKSRNLDKYSKLNLETVNEEDPSNETGNKREKLIYIPRLLD